MASRIWRPSLPRIPATADHLIHNHLGRVNDQRSRRRVPISEVSRWLGHKSITTTVDLYGHLVPEASGRARDALDKAFAGLRMCPQCAPVRP